MDAEICIDELMVDCLIGCLDRERTRSQRVRVDLSMTIDLDGPADSDRLSDTWNYAEVAAQVAFVLQQGRYHLLETAARTLLRYLLLPPTPGERRPPVTCAQVSLIKFGVLPGAARPRVVVSGRAADARYTIEEKPWGRVLIVDENRRSGLYRLEIAPGRELPNHVHRQMREAELMLTGGLLSWRDGGPEIPVEPGALHLWAHDQPHGYRNPLPRPAAILCLDAPPFIPDDEIELPRETAPAELEEAPA